MEWYPRYVSLWRAKTMHLDPYQEGCYLRLVDHYMETRQPLPDNDHALARIIGISLGDWMGMAAAIVRPFFLPCKDGLLRHKRCDAILGRQDGRNRIQSEKGKKGALKRWNKNKDLHGTGIAQAWPDDSRGEERRREEIKDSPLESPPPTENLFPLTQPSETKNAPSKPRRKSSTHIDGNFAPDLDGLKLASDLNFNVEQTTREFIDYWKSVGKPMSDWQATYRNRLRQLAKYRAEDAKRASGRRSNVADVAGATLRVRTLREQTEPKT